MLEEHNWDWGNGKWTCLDCGKVAKSTDAFIEPCLVCGAPVGADVVHCQKCLEEA